MQVSFTAMQTLSRHFLLTPLSTACPCDRLAHHLTGHKSGVRAEGVIFYECEELPNGERLFGADYYRSSGISAALPADGARVLTAYLQKKDPSLPQTLRILSNGEIRGVSAQKSLSGARAWTVNLPPPSFDADRVGLVSHTPLLGQKIGVDAFGTTKMPFYALSLGTSHAVTFEFGTSLQALRPASIALPLSVRHLFSRPFCTVFAELTREDALSVRVFDIEQGELDASSEGAAAAVSVAHLLGLCPTARDVRVKTRGGTLTVRADFLGAPIAVTAQVHDCFDGVTDLDLLTGEAIR